jgi:hypothetical protein
MNLHLFFMFFSALTDDLCCVWFIYTVLCCFWCPEIGTSSINLNQLGVETETEFSHRNAVF